MGYDVVFAVLQQVKNIRTECILIFCNGIHCHHEITFSRNLIFLCEEMLAEFYGNGSHLRVDVVDGALKSVRHSASVKTLVMMHADV